jgi:hypothetical protein
MFESAILHFYACVPASIKTLFLTRYLRIVVQYMNWEMFTNLGKKFCFYYVMERIKI